MDTRYELRPARRRRRWLLPALAAVVVAGTTASVMADAATPAAPRHVAHSHVAARRGDVQAPVPFSSSAGGGAAGKLPRPHVLRSLLMLHRLVHVHRVFYVRRFWRRRWF